MAIPVRGIPVLEGEVARKFEREARKAEKERGTIKYTKEKIAAINRMLERSKINFV
jgi:hypothetical protein